MRQGSGAVSPQRQQGTANPSLALRANCRITASLSQRSRTMNRRTFLSASAAALAAASVAPGDTPTKPKRVGLIGCGWYGKADLFRLLQVEPVQVVSLCDVDKKMLAGAADMVAERQASHAKPRTFGDYREMLKQKDLD